MNKTFVRVMCIALGVLMLGGTCSLIVTGLITSCVA